MKHVTFARAMAPFGAGDKRLVPDEVAARLEAEGVLSAVETWPAHAPPAPSTPQRPAIKPRRPVGVPDGRTPGPGTPGRDPNGVR